VTSGSAKKPLTRKEEWVVFAAVALSIKGGSYYNVTKR